MPTRRTPDPFAALLGAHIRGLRTEKKMSLARLATASDLSKGHVSNLEHGLVMITARTACALAKALDVPILIFFVVPETKEDFWAFVEHLRVHAPGEVFVTASVLRDITFGKPKRK